MDNLPSLNVILLAGGGGTRLWPLSREHFPKQFLSFDGTLSLLQLTASRFLERAKRLVISTNALYEPLVQQQMEKIDPAQKGDIVIEPSQRNTAPAIVFALHILSRHKGLSLDEPILVVPSDHFIEPESVFLRCIDQAIGSALNGNLVLFGIRPTKPDTGFGYIRVGRPVDSHCYEALSFVEKPPLLKAIEFLQTRQYYWNAGMFAFTPRTLLQELEAHAPKLFAAASSPNLEDLYPSLPHISIDYALLEKSKRVVVFPLPVEWSDVGSWDSVYDALPKDSDQNVQRGHVVAIDTKNSLILGDKRLVCTVGVEDLLIVETEDAIFISKRGESQKVKQLVNELLQRSKKKAIY